MIIISRSGFVLTKFNKIPLLMLNKLCVFLVGVDVVALKFCANILG
jgi:hypothetical protein